MVADCQPLLAVNTSPPPVRKSAARESGILVTREVEVKHEVGSVHEVKVNYEVNVRHEAEQVRCYVDFLRSWNSPLLDRNMTSTSFCSHIQATIGSFTTWQQTKLSQRIRIRAKSR